MEDESDVEQLLLNLLASEDCDECVMDVRSFEGVGVLTSNRGVVFSTPEGREFQLTIIRSR